MKFNFNVPIKEIDGTTIKEGDREILIKDACVKALLTDAPGLRFGGELKFKKYNLAINILGATKEIELDKDDLGVLKSAAGESLPTLVLGRLFDILNGKKE